MIHLDTHVVAWLYDSPRNRFPPGAVSLLSTVELRISPMVRLELDYLHEIGRLRPSSDTIFTSLASTLGLTFDQTPFSLIIEHASRLSWTRDPFDRLIVAHALAAGARLMTADQTILAHCSDALWA